MRINPVDPRTLADDELTMMHEILTAVAANDHPDLPAPARGDLEERLTYPWPGCRLACWLGWDNERTRALGLAWLMLPGDANSGVAELTLAVLPGDRRSGAGRGLLREAVRLAYSMGRTTMIAAAEDGGAAADFAVAMGARPALNDVHAVLQVSPPTDPPTAGGSGDYELLRLRGATPPELLAALGAVHEGMADAPVGTSTWSHQRYDGSRVAAVDSTLEARGLVQLRVLARHRPTGDIVGVTYVIVSPRSPYRSEQGDTTVLPAHRGNRLGLAMKVEMLHWLSADYPEVRELNTWVAQDNAPIRAVNAQLGYRVAGHWTHWQADVPDLAKLLGMT
ncbi:MAG: GNAT family N-acetyltransferase [Geodermatophilaceae bacterium]|nr:GNAT family N-acetyltransferase [Geodermatophilaceae bacterium]MDQ3464577.1 GNAT family N-acetyltransferase [Actinomycetota bacterium]